MTQERQLVDERLRACNAELARFRRSQILFLIVTMLVYLGLLAGAFVLIGQIKAAAGHNYSARKGKGSMVMVGLGVVSLLTLLFAGKFGARAAQARLAMRANTDRAAEIARKIESDELDEDDVRQLLYGLTDVQALKRGPNR